MAAATRVGLSGLVLLLTALFGCGEQVSRREEKGKEMENVVLGEVRIGKELNEFYIAYTADAAVLGFAVKSEGAPTRYFPLYTSTDRGVPAVELDVFASKSEDEMWVRSSWPGSEVLGYRHTGEDTAITPFGKVTFLEQPTPKNLSGGPVPFPEMPIQRIVKKATFRHKAE